MSTGMCDNKVVYSSQERNINIDFLRGIAIILVVFGHCIQYGSGNAFCESEAYFRNNLFQFIYSFHMPLFALISGYLFFWSLRRSCFELLKKQILSLLVPIVVWKGLEALARGAMHILHGTFNIKEFFSDYFSTLPDAFWFLWAIFWCSVVVMIIEKALRGKWWIYILFLIVMLFIPSMHNVYMYVFMYPYFVVGFWFHKQASFGNKNRSLKQYIVLSCTCIASFIILLAFYNRNSFIYTTKISIIQAECVAIQLGIDLYRWLIGFVGSCTIILIVTLLYKQFSKSVLIKFCASLGQISLGIYILNTYTNNYVLRRITYGLNPNILLWILETLISITLYYAFIWIIRRNLIVNKLLLGGR